VRVVAERFGTALCLNDISSCEQTEFVVGPLCFGGGIVVDWAFPFILRSACGSPLRRSRRVNSARAQSIELSESLGETWKHTWPSDVGRSVIATTLAADPGFRTRTD
jgi:hypothetical protein